MRREYRFVWTLDGLFDQTTLAVYEEATDKPILRIECSAANGHKAVMTVEAAHLDKVEVVVKAYQHFRNSDDWSDRWFLI
jgi:hypothetical protein